MKESTEQLLKDLQDVIEALALKKCRDENFRKLWMEKYSNVVRQFDLLSEDEYNDLKKEYEKWFQLKYGIANALS